LESGFLKEDFLETYAEQSLVESLSEFLKFAGTKKKKKKNRRGPRRNTHHSSKSKKKNLKGGFLKENFLKKNGEK